MNILVKLDVPTINIDINYLYEIVLLLYHFYLAGFQVHISKKNPSINLIIIRIPTCTREWSAG